MHGVAGRAELVGERDDARGQALDVVEEENVSHDGDATSGSGRSTTASRTGRVGTSEDMAVRALPPFRADHVGSLLRPPDLLDARARHQAGELDADGLRAVEDVAIRDVVALQRDAGVRTATDGEFRRTSWHMDFIYQLEGVDPTDQKLAVHFHNKDGDLDFEAAALSVHDRIGLGHTIFGDAFEFLQGVVERPGRCPS